MGQFSSFYNTRAWRRLSVWKRSQDPLCEMCLKLGIFTPSVDVDHIKPLATPEGWDRRLDSDNLAALCVPCHSTHKARQERTGFLAGNDTNGEPLDTNSAWFSR